MNHEVPNDYIWVASNVEVEKYLPDCVEVQRGTLQQSM